MTTQFVVRLLYGERPDQMVAVNGSFADLEVHDVLDLVSLISITVVDVGLAVPAGTSLPVISTVDWLNAGRSLDPTRRQG